MRNEFYKHGNSMKGQSTKMTMTVTSAITNEPIRIDTRDVNALAVSYHSNELGFIRMESGRTWIVKEPLAKLAKIYADEIRRLENGRPGLDFGVGESMDSGHPAHRFRDGKKSFLVQARWAAGTIAKRYDGNLLKFARRYCPPNPWKWYVGVSSFIERLKAEDRNGKKD